MKGNSQLFKRLVEWKMIGKILIIKNLKMKICQKNNIILILKPINLW